MKLSRALVLAGSGMDMPAEQLCSLAQALAMKQATAATTPGRIKPAPVTIAARDGAGCGDANLRAMQASRSLLTRTIAMLK